MLGQKGLVTPFEEGQNSCTRYGSSIYVLNANELDPNNSNAIEAVVHDEDVRGWARLEMNDVYQDHRLAQRQDKSSMLRIIDVF